MKGSGRNSPRAHGQQAPGATGHSAALDVATGVSRIAEEFGATAPFQDLSALRQIEQLVNNYLTKPGKKINPEALRRYIDETIVATIAARSDKYKERAEKILETSKKEFYKSLTMQTRVQYYALADSAFDGGLSLDDLKEAIEQKLAEKAKEAARETTDRATAEPRSEKESLTPLSSPKVQAVFGNIPPEFQTKRRSKSIIPEDAIHDPEVVQTAKDIVNANRRTKIEALEPKARETLRRARRIVRANEGGSPT